MSRDAVMVRTDARAGRNDRVARVDHAAGVFRSGDGRGTVRVRGAACPMTVSPGGVPEHRGANAVVVQKPALPADDVGLVDPCPRFGGPVTEATDDRADRAHAVTDARGELVCSTRVPDAKPRVYHRSDMVTRYVTRYAVVGQRRGGGVRCRVIRRVERVSFETRERDVAAAEQRLRHDLDTTLADRALVDVAAARSIAADRAYQNEQDRERDLGDADGLLAKASEVSGSGAHAAHGTMLVVDQSSVAGELGGLAAMGLVSPTRSVDDDQGAWVFTGDGTKWAAAGSNTMAGGR